MTSVRFRSPGSSLQAAMMGDWQLKLRGVAQFPHSAVQGCRPYQQYQALRPAWGNNIYPKLFFHIGHLMYGAGGAGSLPLRCFILRPSGRTGPASILSRPGSGPCPTCCRRSRRRPDNWSCCSSNCRASVRLAVLPTMGISIAIRYRSKAEPCLDDPLHPISFWQTHSSRDYNLWAW